jgi:hypothetical protein
MHDAWEPWQVRSGADHPGCRARAADPRHQGHAGTREPQLAHPSHATVLLLVRVPHSGRRRTHIAVCLPGTEHRCLAGAPLNSAFLTATRVLVRAAELRVVCTFSVRRTTTSLPSIRSSSPTCSHSTTLCKVRSPTSIQGALASRPLTVSRTSSACTDAAALLCATRASLGFTCSSRGLVSGCLFVKEARGAMMDCRRQTYSIPGDPELILR